MKHITTQYSKIDNYFYIGTNQCCEFHFKKILLKEGIRADLSLEEDRVDIPFGVDYYLWLPTKDHYAPSKKQLFLGIEFIDFCVKNKVKLYLHCKNGHTRAPTMLAAYLVKKKNMHVLQAFNYIKLKRPEIHPTAIQAKTINKLDTTKK